METAITTTLDFSALQRADLQPGTRRHYVAATQRLLAAGLDPFDYEALADFAADLPHSTRAALKAAINIQVSELSNSLKAGATIENAAEVQVQLWRLEAVNKAIKVHAPKGKVMALWLSPDQVREITSKPDRTTQRGRRDWIVLATLLGSGLRVDEMASLTFDQLKRQPTKNGQFRGVLSFTGKGRKKRSVPISEHLETRLIEWKKETGGGRIARGFKKGGRMTDSLSTRAVSDIVHHYGAMIGLPELEVHDLRRTWAQLGLEAGIPIQQISILLGHSSLTITQKYLDLQVDLSQTVSDFIPLSGD